MREGLDHWPFIWAAYVLGIGGTAAMVLWAWLGMVRAESRRDRSRTAGTHHTRQRKQRSQQRAAKARLPKRTQQPVTRDQHLNQRTEDHPQHCRFPYREEIDHRVIQRRLPRISIRLRKDRFTDTVGFGSSKRFAVVRFPFHIPETGNDNEKEKRGFPPLNGRCRLR